MPPSTPLFSIVIPTFNRVRFLQQALKSVFFQNFSDFEVIVIDDGSTDTTENIVISFNNKITCIKHENCGPELSRNKGMVAARGKYIAFLDSDDVLLPNALTVYHSIIKRNKPGLIFAKGISFRDDMIDSTNSSLNQKLSFTSSDEYLKKKKSTWLSTSFMVAKRESLIDNNVFFKKGTFPVDDLDFLLRASSFLRPCVFIDTPATVGYRYHSSNSVADVQKNCSKLKLIIEQETNSEYPGGKKMRNSRLACIGGHVQSWFRKGMRKGIYLESLSLLIAGIPSLIALCRKKIGDQLSLY